MKDDDFSDFSNTPEEEHIDAHSAHEEGAAHAPADLQTAAGSSKDPSASHSDGDRISSSDSEGSDHDAEATRNPAAPSDDAESTRHVPAALSDNVAPRGTITRSFANRTVLEIAGLGELRYYHQTGMMAAACLKHSSSDCRKSATTRPKTSRHAGRPIGHLVAWLQQQSNYNCQSTHVHACLPSHSERVAARAFFSGLQDSAEWLGWEKTKQPGDPDEPP